MTKKRSENAIILIGNGFDLAHGMKTSYNDFSEWYLNKNICNNLINIICNLDYYNKKNNIFKERFFMDLKQILEDYLPNLNGSYDRLDFDYIKNLRTLLLNKEEHERISIIRNELNKETFNIKRIIKNEFLGNLYSNTYNNWFDIESSYYFELTKRLEKEGIIEFDVSYTSPIESLNNEFEIIKNALKEYLKTIEIKHKNKVSEFFIENFIGKENINIVNFNYTNTINQYINNFTYSFKPYDTTKTYTNTNYIHGELDRKIIFGYGDDDSEEYKRMKQTQKDEYLKNFKTFAYLESNHYRNLISLLNSLKDYEVYVLGHSLSLTDKTLLYEILSPEKCLNIHLFKRDDLLNEEEKNQNIKKLHFNISRILNNDADSRKKIVPLESTPHFPFNGIVDKQIIKEKYKSIYGEEINNIIKRDDSPQVTYY